jgi:hypothetical protein
MTRWIPCGARFVEGDDLRWLEAVWKPKARRNDKAMKIGGRMIVAQVVGCDKEWADLRVIHCETAAEEGWTIHNLTPGQMLQRRRDTLGRAWAATERKLWSDESARAMVASVFFKADDAAPARPSAQVKASLAGEMRGPRRTGGGRRGYGKGRRQRQLRP